ncbi:MAG: tetratricopeptide repeat protein [Bacteroidaceae bacterium]|nr:tetratricopeptide repeat protein [Bacteroidaceae bacterium]
MDNLSKYILNPGSLNRETLYDLRIVVGRYPYFDAARLLMLRNLYLLHDIEFGKELRKAALYLKNRRVLLELMEDYGATDVHSDDANPSVDRTMSLIDAFLESVPNEKFSLEAEGAAAVDYVSTYLSGAQPSESAPKMRGQELIDEFLSGENEKISLQLQPDPSLEESAMPVEETEPDTATNLTFTETLANIYIKQGKYSKALEIIQRLCLEYPNKNRYFADQIRFLEKIIKYKKN